MARSEPSTAKLLRAESPPLPDSIWEAKQKRFGTVEVVTATADTTTYRILRAGNYQRQTTVPTARFLAKFLPVPRDQGTK